MSAVIRWARIVFLWSVALLITVVIGLLFFEQVQRLLADRNYPVPGRLIDVGGHQLHALVRGDGTPTVIFESGLGIDGHLSWYKVQDPVAQFAKTLSYDRAGIFWSERGENPKTAAAISSELESLLRSADLAPPYILVGHSFAGNTLRPFIVEHSRDIAGIVFVDVSHPEQYSRYPKAMGERSAAGPPPVLMQIMRNLGILRYLLTTGPKPTDDQSDIFATVVPSMVHRGIGVRHESANVESIANEVAHLTDFGDIPLIVITGADPQRNQGAPFPQEVIDELVSTQRTLQEELLALSTNSRQILALKSDHYVQISEPELVIAAIRSLVAEHAEN